MIVCPRIALIHAVFVAIDPIKAAFRKGWPEVELVNLLDDSLSIDRARDAELMPEMFSRIRALGNYAETCGAQAILFSCSAFGPAIDACAAHSGIPILKPNEAMFTAALAEGQNIGMLATFRPSVASMEAEFHEMTGAEARLTTVLVDGALDALKSGDVKTHNELVANAATQLEKCDAVLLAHFSTARARKAVENVVEVPVLNSPDCAVGFLKQELIKSPFS